SRVMTGTPCNTALMPPTTTNSTCPSIRRRMVSLAKDCIVQSLFDEESPALVLLEALLRAQAQKQLDLRLIHLASVAEVIHDIAQGVASPRQTGRGRHVPPRASSYHDCGPPPAARTRSNLQPVQLVHQPVQVVLRPLLLARLPLGDAHAQPHRL